jgi:glycosyltransferase involved in cell wall biosynthesis
MKSNRIIHVPRRFVTHEWGGTETVIASLALEQLRQGLLPEIHTSLALSRERAEKWNDVPVRRYSYCYPFFGLSTEQKAGMDKKGGNLLSLPLFFSLAAAREIRIFHAHALKRLGGAVFTAAHMQKKPFVVTLHGGVFDVPAAELSQMMEAQRGKWEWGKVFGALFRSRKILEDADAVICVGRGEYDHARKTLGHDRIHHLGNGVDAGRFSAGDGAVFRKAHGIPAEAIVLACYSRIDPQKDQVTLIEAFDSVAAQLPLLHLVLAGPVTVPSWAQKIDECIARSSHAARIRRLGPIPFTGCALADAYHACDVFVLPSRHEPFGIVILEAWSAGKPVIVSRVGGLRHLIAENSDGLFFDSGDIPGCAAQIRALAADESLRRALGEAGRRKAGETYSWKSIADATEQIYQQAIAHATARK